MKVAIYHKDSSVLLNVQYFLNTEFEIEALIQSDLKIDKEKLKAALQQIVDSVEVAGQEKPSHAENI